MLFHNMGLLIEILCLDLLNLKGSTLQSEALKSVGHLWLGFWTNLLWNNDDAKLNKLKILLFRIKSPNSMVKNYMHKLPQ